MPKRVLVISNMYPSAEDPTYGIFVARCVAALQAMSIDTQVIGMKRNTALAGKLLDYIRFFFAANFAVLVRG